MTDAELDQCRHDSALLHGIIARQVALRREGDHWKGCCPFHDDRDPSFAVYVNGFHCFACGAKGSVFDYVMRRDRVEFHRAVEIIAAERGFSSAKQRTNGQGGHSTMWQPIVPVPQDAPPPTDRQLGAQCDAVANVAEVDGAIANRRNISATSTNQLIDDRELDAANRENRHLDRHLERRAPGGSIKLRGRDANAAGSGGRRGSDRNHQRRRTRRAGDEHALRSAEETNAEARYDAISNGVGRTKSGRNRHANHFE